MATVTITDENFKSGILESDKPVLVDFWAEWCGPCKQMGPALEALSEELEGKAVIAKVNIEDATDAPLDYNVRGVPTLMIFKGGKQVASRNGAMTQGKMSEWLSEFI